MESWELNNSNATNHTILVLLVTKLEVTKNLVMSQTYAKIGHYSKVWKILFLIQKTLKVVFSSIQSHSMYFMIKRNTEVPLKMIK